MKNIKINYQTPNVERIQLDCDISLALQSGNLPWTDPSMSSALAPETTFLDSPLTTLPM